MSFWKSKRVLITGGTGFIGSHLTRRLMGLGADVAVTTKYNSVVDNVRIVDLWNSVRVIEADVRNSDSLRAVADWKPQVVYHLAAYNHVGDSFTQVQEAMSANAMGSANILECWKGYERFVYISTSEVYGYQAEMPFTETMTPHPISPYSVGKYAGELYAQMKMSQLKRPIVVLRPFNAFGPYQSQRAVISEVIYKCLAGLPIAATEGRQTRDFNYVTNLVDGMIRAVESDKAVGNVINVGSGQEITIRDLITTIHEETESSSELQFGKLPIRDTEIWRMGADNRRAQDLLGWTPSVDFREGIRRTIAWYKAYLQEFGDAQAGLARLANFKF